MDYDIAREIRNDCKPRSGDRSLSPGWSRQAEPWVEPHTGEPWRGGRKAPDTHFHGGIMNPRIHRNGLFLVSLGSASFQLDSR